MDSDLAEDSALVDDEQPAAEDVTDDRAEDRSARRLLRLAVIGGIALVALAVAVLALLSSSSPSHSSTGTGIPAGDTTATVTRRTLTESATLDGTLGYGGSLELYDRLSEAGTFTWLPAVGAVIARGGTLFRVNNLPVALMYGSVPAYRTLKEGVSKGPDVTELNQNLIDLGFDPYSAISDSEEFTEATAAAVRRWQKAEGLSETGEVELGRVIFAPGAQRVTKLHVSLGQDPPGSSEGAHEGQGSEQPASEGTKPPEKESPKQETKEPGAAEKGAEKQAPSKRPRAGKKHGKGHGSPKGSKKPAPQAKAPEESSKEPSSKSPSSSGEHPSGKGGEGAGGMPVLNTTSTQQLVTLQVKADQQQLAHVGESAPVRLPNGSVAEGHIASVGTVASESSEGEKGGGEKGGGSGGGGGESATIAVTIVLDHPVAHLDAAPVSVELVKESRHSVLAVPATSLTATAGGGYAVQTLQAGRRVDLPVTPGLFANGYVQVEGAGIHEGLTVIESQ